MGDPPTFPRSILAPYRWGDAPTETKLWALEVQRRTARRRMLESEPDPERRAKLQAAELEMCRRDTVYWIEQWGWVRNPHAAGGRYPNMIHVPAVLWPDQQRLVRWLEQRIDQGETSLVTKGRSLGVTWCHLLVCAKRMTLGRNWTARLASAKEDKVDDGTPDSLFGMLRYILARLPSWLSPHDASKEDARLWLGCKATDADVVGESANRGLARGGRRTWLLLDEFAHIDPPSKAWELWASTATVARSRAVISTHKGPATRFAELEAQLPAHQVYRMTWRADPRRPANFQALEMAQGMSEREFEQEHEARAVVLTEGLMFEGPLDQARLAGWEADERPLDQKGKRPRMNIRSILWHDQHPDWIEANREWDLLRRGFLCGGWDFGTSAVSALVCLRAVIEPGPAWRVWIDAEHKWHQTDWMRAAHDVHSWERERYGEQSRSHWGDPAGIQRESDLKSWQENLRAGGVPLTCLDAYYNTRDGQEWAIREAQSLIDSGRLRIHARCTYLWGCLENWSRDIPHGASAALINRLYIPPRHDDWSHGGMAFVYLVAGIILGMSAAHESSRLILPADLQLGVGLGSEVGRILSAGYGGR